MLGFQNCSKPHVDQQQIQEMSSDDSLEQGIVTN